MSIWILDFTERERTRITPTMLREGSFPGRRSPHPADSPMTFWVFLKPDRVLPIFPLHLDEKTKANSLSPAVVCGNEALIREIFRPEHVNDNGVLIAAAPVCMWRIRAAANVAREYCAPNFSGYSKAENFNQWRRRWGLDS